MNIAVMGAGYVGLVTGTCFAELGNHVTCIDVNRDKIAKLKEGHIPIYESGLDALLRENVASGRLHFETGLQSLLEKPDAIFIAVGTPSDKEGAADIQYVQEVASEIGRYISSYTVVVDKSTVPVGMAEEVKKLIQHELNVREMQVDFDVVSNPEFLREGAAIEDFMKPDRVVIGIESDRAEAVMRDLYLPILRHPERIYFMRIRDAEMTKYVANAMLATRISFMNEMALLCERMDADIDNVRIGIGADHRIGSAFLYPGCGYGGSCFPKDVRALIKMAKNTGFDPLILNAVEERNRLQKQVLAQKLFQVFGEDWQGLQIAVWGLAFKPGTDDMREASSQILIEELIKRGAHVKAYDPVAGGIAKTIFSEAISKQQLEIVDQQYDALKQADALVLVTEWKPFCYPDVDRMKNEMHGRVIIDGRNQYDPKHMRSLGFIYYGIGRP